MQLIHCSSQWPPRHCSASSKSWCRQRSSRQRWCNTLVHRTSTWPPPHYAIFVRFYLVAAGCGQRSSGTQRCNALVDCSFSMAWGQGRLTLVADWKYQQCELKCELWVNIAGHFSWRHAENHTCGFSFLVWHIHTHRDMGIWEAGMVSPKNMQMVRTRAASQIPRSSDFGHASYISW